MDKDRVVANLWVRFIKWSIEHEHRIYPSCFELGQKFRALVRPEIQLHYQSPRSFQALDRIVRISMQCCSQRASRRFDAHTIRYLIGFLTEQQQDLAVSICEDLYGDYYRENLIYEFERSIAPLSLGQQREFLSRFNSECD